MIKTARRPEPGQPPLHGSDPLGPAQQAHFRSFYPVNTWEPPVNLYRLDHRLDVCVDLAGVEPGSVNVRVEMDRLFIEGDRCAPQPTTGNDEPMCIVSMEIDHGPFCRTITLSQKVDHTGVSIRYAKGLLWIHLPISQTP